MTRWLPIVACASLLAACGSGSKPPPLDAGPAVGASAAPIASVAHAPVAPAAGATTLARYDGYGDMRFGIDPDAFARAWSGALASATPAPGSSCFYVRPTWVKAPGDFAFMFEGGHFVRYDVGTPKESAPGGGKVGMSAAQILALYPQVRQQPHKYVQGAQSLRVTAAQGATALVFETDAGGKVTRWHVGEPPQVDYVEGCG